MRRFKGCTIPKAMLAGMAVALMFLAPGCTSQQARPTEQRKSYVFWPPVPDPPHVQFLTTFNTSQDVALPQSSFEKAIYGQETAPYAIVKPYGVRMWNGCIYICDVRAKGVTIFDLRKHETRIMGASGAVSINKAVDMAIAPDGTKYIVDVAQGAVLVFGADDRYARTILLPPQMSPVGIALFGERLYVTDFKGGDVKILDRTTGSVVGAIGSHGAEPGQFVGPLAVATDKAGNVYVTDTVKSHVQKFSPDGKLLLGFGETGTRPGNFARPKQLAVASDGHIHVVDAMFNNVQVFDPEGRIIGYYGSPGTHPGAMDMPAGIDIHQSDLELFARYVHPAFEVERLVLVANQFGDQKISVYALGHLKPGKTVKDISAGRATIETGITPATQPATQPAGQR